VSALSVADVSHDFGGLRALHRVSLAVEPGQRMVILGPNGAGKTTIFNVITGLLRATAGSIRLFDRDVTRLPAYRRARLGLGRTFQISTLFPRLSVLDSVLLSVHGADGAGFTPRRGVGGVPPAHERARAILAEWGLWERRDVPTRLLSYGEQRQVELVLALAARPRVLLLDEPTAGLSPAETASVAAMIRRFPREVTILMIEHDMDVALELADRVTVLFQGQVLAQGTREEMQRDPRVAEIYLGGDDA
jgi:branched-chain amino acid transport system ATP-binding protein